MVVMHLNLVAVFTVIKVEGCKVGGGGLIMSSQTTILYFTSHETKFDVFTLLKNRGRTKCLKRYVSPIL